MRLASHKGYHKSSGRILQGRLLRVSKVVSVTRTLPATMVFGV